MAQLVAEMARGAGEGAPSEILDLTAETRWLATALRGRGLRVVRSAAGRQASRVAVGDPVGLEELAREDPDRLAAAVDSLDESGWILLIDSSGGEGGGAPEGGLELAAPTAAGFIARRFDVVETLHFHVQGPIPGDEPAGSGASRRRPGAAHPRALGLRVLAWSSASRHGPSLESLLLAAASADASGRVVISRESRAGAAPRPSAPTAGADLDVADVLDEVAALREELDRDLYRAARRGRDALARVPYALPAAKVVLRAAIRTRQFVRSRRSASRSSMPVPLDPEGTAYPARDRWLDFDSPEVSIVILNWNRGPLTLAALQHVWRNTTGASYEALLVDNGSLPGDLRLAHRHRDYFREVRIGVNRYFGEGNNIGAEEAHGRLLIFLNNDAMPQPGWLEPLLWAMRQPSVGAAGSRLLFPDGRIQETGALIQPDGTPIQLEKGMPFQDGTREPLRQVDYCSAAAICLTREDFLELGGFDLTWEPAYYEDVDLCMKLQQAGKRVVCATESHVVHLEHATTSSTGKGLDLRGQPEFNRPKFVERWGQMLHQRSLAGADRAAPTSPTPRAETAMPRAALRRDFKVGVYSPYQMVPGGGERYLLMLAAALGGSGPCTLLFPDRYSEIRIRQVAQELGVPIPGRLDTGVWDRQRRSADFDYFVTLGNEVTPPVGGLGQTNVYVCQFPFPAPARILKSRAPADQTYQHVFVYSDFSAAAYAAARSAIGLPARRPAVVSPPCGSQDVAPRPIEREVIRIVSVGRFFRGGHEKRHDIMIKALRELLGSGPGTRSLELHLVGTAMQQWDSRSYLRGLESLARGLPVTFHVNAPGAVVGDLLETSHVYWHCAGFDVDEARHPERLEHFGISIVEAMARGCVPVAYDAGGPREIVSDGVNGRLYRTFQELIDVTATLVGQAASGAPQYDQLRDRASERARDFSDDRFVDR
ncbi:MAG: glycosyltransferase, partial [Candidatus Dormiibacterota bacterium]